MNGYEAVSKTPTRKRGVSEDFLSPCAHILCKRNANRKNVARLADRQGGRRLSRPWLLYPQSNGKELIAANLVLDQYRGRDNFSTGSRSSVLYLALDSPALFACSWNSFYRGAD